MGQVLSTHCSISLLNLIADCKEASQCKCTHLIESELMNEKAQMIALNCDNE